MSLIIIVLSVILLVSICFVIAEKCKNERIFKIMLLGIVYSLSKFFYGVQMGMLSKTNSPNSVLFIVMIAVALLQMPNVKIKAMFNKKGVLNGFFSRIPNAAGLFTEALAAKNNILFYTMIQPMQQMVLFIYSIFIKEHMGKRKLIGSILSLVSVGAIAILTLFYTY